MPFDLLVETFSDFIYIKTKAEVIPQIGEQIRCEIEKSRRQFYKNQHYIDLTVTKVVYDYFERQVTVTVVHI
jgi:hypothetical protein